MDVAETLECPTCGITCTVDTSQDPIVINYNFDEWRKHCTHPNADDLATCPQMLPSMRRMIGSR
jgi:hypothetical protein